MKARNHLKAVSALLAAALLLAGLAACAGESPTGNPSGSVSPPPPSGAASPGVSGSTGTGAVDPGNGGDEDVLWEGPVSKVVMTFMTVGVTPPDILLVQDAINEISIPRAGVEVELKVLSIIESRAYYPTWIATREPMDLMLIAFTNIFTYINQNMLYPLDDMIPLHAPYIYSLGLEYPIYDAAILNGQAYGVSTVKAGYGGGGSYVIAKSALDAAGLKYNNDDKVTLDDLTDIFARVKAAMPDMYPCGVTGLADAFGFTHIADALGDTPISGALIGTQSTKVVNLFETPEYYDYLTHLREWYRSGYIIRDAATTDMNQLDYIMAGMMCGYFSDGPEYLRAAAELQTGEEYVQLQLLDPYYPSISSQGNVYWSVPVSAANPEGALRFLDLMFKNRDVVNLLLWGIEGKNWVFTDRERGLIGFPEGLDATNNGFYNPYGVYGDTRMCYVNDESLLPGSLVEFGERALANPTMGVGFCYDSSAMATQIMELNRIYTEYRPALCTGTADLDRTYPEFIQKLKQAGIDGVIADKQAQFDAWRAARG